MLLSSSRLTLARFLMALALFVPGTGACNSDDVATSEGSSSTTSAITTVTTLPTTSVTDTAEPPIMYDPNVCEFDAKMCTEPADCCGDPNPDNGCPDVYPDKWTCDSGSCFNGGCTADSDCIIPGLACQEVGDIGQCVVPCTPSAIDPCITLLPGTSCIGVSDTAVYFCIEGLP